MMPPMLLTSSNYDYDYDTVQPCFFLDGEEEDFYAPPQLLPGPGEDIWKKFELLPTPPLSPSRRPSPSAADRLEAVSDLLDQDCSPSAAFLQSFIIQDCMWSSSFAAATELERLVSERLASLRACRDSSSSTSSGAADDRRPANPGYLQDLQAAAAECIDPAEVFTTPGGKRMEAMEVKEVKEAEVCLETPPLSSSDSESALMTVPQMSVTTSGGDLQVTFDKLPPSSAVSVTVWKKGHETQAAVFSLGSEQTLLHVAALQVGVMYCISAQVVLDSGLHSSSTDTRCVSVTGAASWKRPTTVIVIVIVMAGILVALFWSVVHCRPDACHTYFHKEPLPQSLKGDWSVQIPMNPQEAELCEVCERIPALLSVDSERRASKTDVEFTAHLDKNKC